MDCLQQLNHRIAVLERRLQHTKRLGISVLILVSSVLIVGQVAPSGPQSQNKRVIEAEEFLVRDRHGAPCIRIGTEGDSSIIRILDRDGDPLVAISGSDKAPYGANVRVVAKNGMTGSLLAGADRVDFTLDTGMDKKAKANLARDIEKGTDLLIAYQQNADPKRRSSIGLSLDERKCEFDIWKDGQPRGGWFADIEYTQVHLCDRDGIARGVWDTAYGTAALALLDDKMKSRLVLGRGELKNVASGALERRSESSVLLFGEDGKVIYSAP